MKYKFEYESENAEQDFATIMDILLNAAERGVKMYKDIKSEDTEAKSIASFDRLNQNVEKLGSKIENLNFKEVDTEKTSSGKDKK